MKILIVLLTMGVLWSAADLLAAVTVTFETVDQDSDQPIASRLHLYDADGEAVFADGQPRWRDHFVHEGRVTLNLPDGHYTYTVERGPHWSRDTGRLNLRGDDTVTVRSKLMPLADLQGEGWWSGDLHVHRPIEDIALLMKAEDLHFAPVISWWNNRNFWAETGPPDSPLKQFDGNRFYRLLGGEDERGGGALMYFNLPEPLPIRGLQREYPSAAAFIAMARRHDHAHLDVEKPFWWDMPIWIATGEIDTIGIAHNHMHRSGVLDSEAWGRTRDSAAYPGVYGNGLWTQDIYYHILNVGLRIPPSAGSASGVLPNPVGYNRAYVHMDGEPNWEKWWHGLRAGRSFVTNGPLLRITADGQLPGHVFTAESAAPLKLHLHGKLQSNDPIRSIQIIRNGRVYREVLHKPGKSDLDLGEIAFDQSGWFLVRVLGDVDHTFRFASTAPFYVEVDGEHRISRQSVRFFIEWLAERRAQLEEALPDEDKRSQVMRHVDHAEQFFQEKLDQANAP